MTVTVVRRADRAIRARRYFVRCLMGMDAVWDGVVRLADAARSYDWRRVFTILDEHQQLVNTTRPGGSSLYAALHQAAYGGAPTDVVLRLVELGAWRTLQN